MCKILIRRGVESARDYREAVAYPTTLNGLLGPIMYQGVVKYCAEPSAINKG